MFYRYHQNNSYGVWNNDENVSETVFIEADSLVAANAKAGSIGIYFNGCDDGMDCPCCGDRWSEPCDDPTEFPDNYGELVDLTKQAQAVIHYSDGRKLDLRAVANTAEIHQ